MKLYPLTAAQRLHFFTLKYCPKKQVLNIGTSLTIGGDVVEFDVLEKAIHLAYERNDAARLRFCEDGQGETLQYIVPKDDRAIEYFDFTGWEFDDAEKKLREWTEIPFPRADSPMNRVVMLTMPDGYKGLYMNVDHMTMDSSSIIVFLVDIISIYCHFQYDFTYPKPMTSYIEALEEDLRYEDGSEAQRKDRAFWQAFIERDEPIFTDLAGDGILMQQRGETGNPELRAASITSESVEARHDEFHLESGPSADLMEFCLEHRIPMVCLFMLGLRTFLSKMNHNEEKVSIKSTIARRGSVLKKKSGGTRIHFFPCRTDIPPETTFMDALGIIQRSQFEIFRHADFDPVELMGMEEHFRHLQAKTYECMSLTYQPMTMTADTTALGETKYKAKWYSNGVAASPLYLTVMHNSIDKGLDFFFEYQPGRVSFKELEYLYYYMCRIIFMGVGNPDITVGEILGTV